MEKAKEVIKSNVKSSMIQLVIAVCGVFAAVFGLSMFNQHLLMSFPLPLRMVLIIVAQWVLFLVPAILMIVNKEKLCSIGFKKENTQSQTGICVVWPFSYIQREYHSGFNDSIYWVSLLHFQRENQRMYSAFASYRSRCV